MPAKPLLGIEKCLAALLASQALPACIWLWPGRTGDVWPPLQPHILVRRWHLSHPARPTPRRAFCSIDSYLVVIRTSWAPARRPEEPLRCVLTPQTESAAPLALSSL